MMMTIQSPYTQPPVREANGRWKVINRKTARRAQLAAERVGAPGAFTGDEWVAVCIEHAMLCAYCGKPEHLVGLLVPEHAIPLSRGGTNYIDNIVPACAFCNSRKGSKTASEYRRWLAERDAASDHAIRCSHYHRYPQGREACERRMIERERRRLERESDKRFAPA